MQPEAPRPDDEYLANMPLPEGLVLYIPTDPTRPFDDNEPTLPRQAELHTRHRENIAAGRPPYAGVTVETCGELRWIFRERGWSGDLDPQGLERADLREADLHGTDLRNMQLMQANLHQANVGSANLSGASLNGANLEDAALTRADLHRALLLGVRAHHANLIQANLRQVGLSGTDLSDAYLQSADLRGALLQRTNLRGANLYGAKVGGADLRWADLSGADITAARMDSETTLAEVELDAATALSDVAWNGVPLTQIDWKPLSHIGDERRAREKQWEDPLQKKQTRKPSDMRIREYHRAARAYRSLALVLREQGLSHLSVTYNARAELMDCHAAFHEAAKNRSLHHPLSWFSPSLQWLKTSSLYGLVWLSAHLGWLLALYFVLILGFTVAYWGLSVHAHTGMVWNDALVLSLSSFPGRGVPSGTGLDDTMRLLSGVEAPLGLLIEALFIAAFTRRIMSS